MFSRKKLKILFGIFAVIVGVFSLVQMPLLGTLILGGVITQGILGGFSGKVGPVVGGKWKDIDYMRSYVIPANPNTAAQQAVRAKFAQLVVTGRALLATILQPYWDPFLSNMSGFNSWISENYALSDSDGVIDRTAVMAKGTLESNAIVSAIKSSTSVPVIYNGVPAGNGLISDFVVAIVYDTSTDIAYFEVGNETRGDAETTVTVPADITPADCFAFTFCFRGTGSELIVSDSTGANVTGT